jgi:Rieske Fe-S protein
VNRRRSLALLGAAAWPPAAACRPKKVDRRLRVPLATLALGQRREVEHGEEVVEVVRTAEGVVARSLLCSHYGCRVAWDASARLYRCPCHEGTFDAFGRPVSGPPPGPLRAVRVAIEGDAALVGEP